MKSIFSTSVLSVISFFILSVFNTSSAETIKYAYDDLNRIESVEIVNNSLADYYYDEIGNRVELTSQILGVFAEAAFSAEPSADTDFVVTFDASASACFENTIDPVSKAIITENRDCGDYTWNFGGAGNIVGGSGQDFLVYQYEAAGTYDVTLTVSVQQDPSISDVLTQPVMALQTEIPAPPIDFVTEVNGNNVTLTAPNLSIEAPDIVRAYIYWGDRERTVTTYPLNDLVNGIAHTYARGGRSYNIRLMVIDSAHNRWDYTFANDADLTVTLQ
jgi:hypothetical protein